MIILLDLFKDYDESQIKNKKIVLIYGGAACGSHLSILHDFFPLHKFILYDKELFKLRTEIDRNKFIIKKKFLDAKKACELKKEY